MVTLVLLRVISVVLLIAANAFFVAAEFALVSVRDTRLQQLIADKRVGARTTARLHNNLDEVLSGVQFGITLASLALGWIGEPTLAELFLRIIGKIPHATVYAHTIAIVVAFSLITYLHVILGEVVPKSLALQRAERVALAVAGPMEVFMTVSRPALHLMNRSSAFVLRAFGSRQVREGSVHSPDELKLMVTASHRLGMLPAIQEDMVHRALELDNVTVREVMTPRPDIFSLPADMTLEEALSRVVDTQHSRIPIYDPRLGPEQILGVLYVKDLVRLMQLRLRHGSVPALHPGSTRLRHIMRDVLVVPETKPLSDLLVEFKQRRRHLAVVVDEFGSTAGVVSVEDVLEQIVGEMEDEFDAAKQPPIDLGPSAEVLEGSENIRDLEIQHQLKLPRDQGFETLAGFVLSRLQKVPSSGESFEYQGRRFTVLEMEGHRIASVKVEPVEGQSPVTAAD